MNSHPSKLVVSRAIRIFVFAFLALGLFAAPPSQAQTDPFSHWPLELRIRGTILLSGMLDDSATLGDALENSEVGGSVTLLVDNETKTETLLGYTSTFAGSADYRVIKRDEKRGFAELETLRDCDTFLWHSTSPLQPDAAKQLHQQRSLLVEFLNRGGTLICVGPGSTAIAAETFREGEDGPSAGLGLLPDCVLGIGATNEIADEFVKQLRSRPRSVGIMVSENSVLRLSGRLFSTTGAGAATFLLAPTTDEGEPVMQTIRQRTRRQRSGNEYLIDLTQWRRRAIDQTLDPFPPQRPDPPHVHGGTLVIVGGGGMPKGLMSEFVELAGGVEKAKLVYVPCSESPTMDGEPSTVRQWKRMGVRHATFIHTKDRNRANNDDEFLAPLKDATGIWFGGGRQWNFADSYYGTKAQTLMQDVVRKGGVVGGSSAGASVQARFLARATPIENFRILAPGYERGGLGFISGVAIDQHFSQRGRQKDMSQLVDRYPQLLGIGIDESTALIVQKSIANVVGDGDVYFYDHGKTAEDSEADYIKLPKGSVYDLAKRQVVRRAEAEETSENTDEKAVE